MSLSAAPSDVQGFKRPERTVSPVSQPLWNRYIDSRLKQFGTTRWGTPRRTGLPQIVRTLCWTRKHGDRPESPGGIRKL